MINLIWIGVACLTGYCGTRISKYYDKDEGTGFLIGFITGLIGLLIYYLILENKRKKEKKDVDKNNDEL